MNRALFLVLVLSLALLAPIPDPGHPAEEIGPGTFAPGDFVFPDQLSVTGNFVVDTNALFVDSSNNRVGIGTNSPDTELHVEGSITLGRHSTESGVPRGVFVYGDETTTPYGIHLGRDSADTRWRTRIFAPDNNRDIAFAFATGSAPYSQDQFDEKMVIQDSGRVGIGTTSPSEKLDVDGRARIRTIDNAAGNILTVSGAGVIQQRTPAQVRADIGAEAAFSKGDVSGGTGISLSGTATNRLVNSGTLTVNLDTAFTDDRYNRRTRATQTASGAGNWFRVAQRTGSHGRGYATVNIYGMGGNQAPRTMQVLWNTDWLGNSVIRIAHNTGGLPISNLRATYDSTTQTAWLEFQLTAATDRSIISEVISMGSHLTTATTGAGGGAVTTTIPASFFDAGGLMLTTGGRVGIGTTTPGTPLEVNGVITATGGTSTNWNTAYGWGDHSIQGYGTMDSWQIAADGTSGTTTISDGNTLTIAGGSGITATRSGSTVTISSDGGGTVESVGLDMPGEFSVSGSPVTESGTLSASWNSQLARRVLAAPSGSSGTPTFRLLVAADIPTLPITTKTSGTLPISRGGTGATTAAGARNNLGVGSMDSWTLQGDTGSGTVNDGQSATIQGGSGITTSVSTRTATIDFDSSWGDGRYVNRAGDSMTDQLDMGNNRITNLADPQNPQDAATKEYVDNTPAGTFESGCFTGSGGFGGTTCHATCAAQGAACLGATSGNAGGCSSSSWGSYPSNDVQPQHCGANIGAFQIGQCFCGRIS